MERIVLELEDNMRKIVCIFFILCLCAACKNDAQVEYMSLLGAKMGNSYEETISALEEKVGVDFVNKSIILSNQKVGPTTFDELRYDFSSYKGLDCLWQTTLTVYLSEDDAKHFLYYWGKEFLNKYGYKSYVGNIDGYVFYSYGKDFRHSHDIEISKVECIETRYRCCLRHIDYYARMKQFGDEDDEQIDNYIEGKRKDYVFMDY